MNVVALAQTNGPSRIQWWNDAKTVNLVWRTAAKDCNQDEFNQFVAVSRDLGLSPLRKQIYAFVFSKDDAAKRSMVIVIGIDGFRSVAARSGNYRPDNAGPEWVYDERAKDPLTNPLGIVSCTVGVYHRPTRSDPFERIVATVFWDEFAPIVESGDPDAYEWVGSGEYFPDGHKKSGQEKMRKRLRPGASAEVTRRLDPKKEQWTKMGRHKIALCAESQALRRGWPDDFARIYVEEEVDKAATVLEDVEFSHLSPSELADKADADARLDKLGGPALLATFDDQGTLERVSFGKFADRVNEHIHALSPEGVAAWAKRNSPALNEFWAHNKTDALALRKEIEQRSAAADNRAVRAADKAEASTSSPATSQKREPIPKLQGALADLQRKHLIKQIRDLNSLSDLTHFGVHAAEEIGRLPDEMQDSVRTEFQERQNIIKARQ